MCWNRDLLSCRLSSSCLFLFTSLDIIPLTTVGYYSVQVSTWSQRRIIPVTNWKKNSSHSLKEFHSLTEGRIPLTHLKKKNSPHWKENSTHSLKEFHSLTKIIPLTYWKNSTHSLKEFHSLTEGKIPLTHLKKRIPLTERRIPLTHWKKNSTHSLKKFHSLTERILLAHWKKNSTHSLKEFHSLTERIIPLTH